MWKERIDWTFLLGLLLGFFILATYSYVRARVEYFNATNSVMLMGTIPQYHPVIDRDIGPLECRR